jgi:hypothetical protein
LHEAIGFAERETARPAGAHLCPACQTAADSRP